MYGTVALARTIGGGPPRARVFLSGRSIVRCDVWRLDQRAMWGVEDSATPCCLSTGLSGNAGPPTPLAPRPSGRPSHSALF